VKQLVYLTRVKIDSNAAQAKQVQCMACAFNEVMGNDFILISYGKPSSEGGFNHKQLSCGGNQWLRYFFVCTETLLKTFSNNKKVFFTRDIAVAALVVMFGGSAVYEAHKQPIGLFPKAIFNLISNSPRFRLVVISNALANYYKENFKIPNEQILVAHDGAFPAEYEYLITKPKEELRKELKLPLDRIIVMHTGSLYSGRGAEFFEHVVRCYKKILFIQVGGRNSDITKWKCYYENKKINNIIFVIHQDNRKVREFQVAADLLFYMITKNTPTYWCCSPMKIFEYMASGTPILAARIGSLIEVIDDSNAFCFNPDSPNSINIELNNFLVNKEEAQRRAEKARQKVYNLYTWHDRAKKIINFAYA